MARLKGGQRWDRYCKHGIKYICWSKTSHSSRLTVHQLAMHFLNQCRELRDVEYDEY